MRTRWTKNKRVQGLLGVGVAVVLVLGAYAHVAHANAEETVFLARPLTRPVDGPPHATVAPDPALQEGRMQILEQEHREQLLRLAAAMAAGEPSQITRMQDDLAALEREMALQRHTPDGVRTSAASEAKQSASYHAQAGPVPAQPVQDAPPQAYAAWDIFKNFGKKDSP